MTSASSASARHHTGHRKDIQARIRNTGFCYYSSVNLPGMGTIPCSTDGIDVFLVVSCVRSSRAAISALLVCFSGRSFTLSMVECHVRFERIFNKISEHVELQNWLILLYQSLPLQQMRFLEQSHSAEKVERGDPFGLFETSVCCKISKNLKGEPFGDKKNREKVAQCQKKIQRGDPVVPSGFVSFVKN